MTKTRTFARRAAAVASAFVVGVTVIGPATADGASGEASSDSAGTRAGPKPNRVFSDPDRAGTVRPGINIATVAVWNRRKSPYFKVTLTGRNFDPERAQFVQLYLNVRRSHEGPEFVVLAFSNKDKNPRKGTRVAITRANKPWKPRALVRCPDAVSRFKVGGADQIRMAVPKRCVGGPHAISVSARVWDLVPGDKTKDYYDAAPGYKKSYPWVKPKG